MQIKIIKEDKVQVKTLYQEQDKLVLEARAVVVQRMKIKNY
jgi:hypothetical protein